MKSVMMILGACLILLFLAGVFDSMTSLRSTEYEEDHIVTTGGGVTTQLPLSPKNY